jgi:transposase
MIRSLVLLWGFPNQLSSDSGQAALRRPTHAITPVIPPKANRNIKRECDFALYCERNLVERFFNLLKHFRAIATRYDKLARNFLAGVQLAAVTILLN